MQYKFSNYDLMTLGLVSVIMFPFSCLILLILAFSFRLVVSLETGLSILLTLLCCSLCFYSTDSIHEFDYFLPSTAFQFAFFLF